MELSNEEKAIIVQMRYVHEGMRLIIKPNVFRMLMKKVAKSIVLLSRERQVTYLEAMLEMLQKVDERRVADLAKMRPQMRTSPGEVEGVLMAAALELIDGDLKESDLE